MRAWSRVSIVFLLLLAAGCADLKEYTKEVVNDAAAKGKERVNQKIDEGTEKVNQAIDKAFDDLERRWERVSAKQKEKLERLEKREQELLAKLQAEVSQKWDKFLQGDKKVWVDYSDDRDAVSQVDFENGKVLLAAVVPADQPDVQGQAKKLLGQELQKVVAQKAVDGKPVMAEMLPARSEAAVSNAKVVGKPFVGKDGVKRVKVQTELPMVQDHLHLRAERYRKVVEANAKKRDVEPSLVMALIHTESAFNPLARSAEPAFGLMQLVPRTAGLEAYQEVYGTNDVPTPDYLYDSNNNIELGVVYLARLHQVYFHNVQDPDKLRYIAICAYNAGPGRVRKIVQSLNPNDMKAKELYTQLHNQVPAETRDYLDRVETRRKLYQ